MEEFPRKKRSDFFHPQGGGKKDNAIRKKRVIDFSQRAKSVDYLRSSKMALHAIIAVVLDGRGGGQERRRKPQDNCSTQ